MKILKVSYKNRRVPKCAVVEYKLPPQVTKTVAHTTIAPRQQKRNKAKPKIVSSLVGVYCILCEDIKTIYIGQSENLNGRIKNHKSLLVNLKHPISALQKDFNLFKEKFEFVILEHCENIDLKYTETFYIKAYTEKGYRVYNTILDTYSPCTLIIANKSYEKVLKRLLTMLESGEITVQQLNEGLDRA